MSEVVIAGAVLLALAVFGNWISTHPLVRSGLTNKSIWDVESIHDVPWWDPTYRTHCRRVNAPKERRL